MRAPSQGACSAASCLAVVMVEVLVVDHFVVGFGFWFGFYLLILIWIKFGVWFWFWCWCQVLCLDADVATMGFWWWLAFSILRFGIWNMLLTTWTRFLIGDLTLDFDLVCVVCFVEFEVGKLIWGLWTFDVDLDSALCCVRMSILSWSLARILDVLDFMFSWILNWFWLCWIGDAELFL